MRRYHEHVIEASSLDRQSAGLVWSDQVNALVDRNSVNATGCLDKKAA